MQTMHNYFRIGGVAAHLPYGWMDKCLDFCDYFLQGVVEYQQLITHNPTPIARVFFFRTWINAMVTMEMSKEW
jgi:NAD(P)H-quinone oxidoreductase subunit H